MSLSLLRGPFFNKRLLLDIAKVIAKVEHIDDQESKGKRNVEQKRQLDKTKGKRHEGTRKGNEGKNRRQIKHEIDGIQDWIQNQIAFGFKWQ